MYQLVDYGNGRKLEEFSGVLVDRPSPVAVGAPVTKLWHRADGRFDLQDNHRGVWAWERKLGAWQLATPFGQMELFPTDFGHLGVFAEQLTHWKWLTTLPLAGVRLLNLFAYTGGASLAAAKAGATVTHVDSAKNMVRRASHNAHISQLADRPIRWIVEDALKFVTRESRRGNQYDGIILDPPTYGHGVSGKSIWKIDEQLPELFQRLREIVPLCRLMLYTCHSRGFTPAFMKQNIAGFRVREKSQSGPMFLQATDGRKLASGNFVRWFQS
ncbi:MAG: class I SAM-dependent methyltransferase [Pirellulaceae bacterium]|nr:class I SAM-dependent methyltransferase [Pirellulaceae bacterium]